MKTSGFWFKNHSLYQKPERSQTEWKKKKKKKREPIDANTEMTEIWESSDKNFSYNKNASMGHHKHSWNTNKFRGSTKKWKI